MKRYAFALVSLLWVGNVLAAKNGGSPPEGELITCELAVAPQPRETLVLANQKECNQAKGTYHYRLWLPPTYKNDTTHHWPCLFIAAAGGNATMGKMEQWLIDNSFIVVMLVESKNGQWAPIVGNFLAAHDDVTKRVRIQEGLKFATGQSGGARASSVFVQLRPGFAGLIMQSAGASQDGSGRYQVAGIQHQAGLFCAMIMGNKDSNYSEMSQMRALLGADKLLQLSFSGGHNWAPAEKFGDAMHWIESRLLETSAGSPAVHALCQVRAQAQLASLPATSNPWERYKKIDVILESVRKGNLQNDPALAPQLPELTAEKQRLNADDAVKKELAAAQALHNAEQMRGHSSPSMFEMICKNIVKQYPGTEAAAQAEKLMAPAK